MTLDLFLLLPSLLGGSEGHPSGTTPFVYGLSEKGKVTINGTLLETLPSNFDEGPPTEDPQERFIGLAAVDQDGDGDSDRFAMRLDGKVWMNGVKIKELPFSSNFWSSLDATVLHWYALRTDGALAVDGTVDTNLPEGNSFFQYILGVDPNVYSLRADGKVYQDTSSTEVFSFTSGDTNFDNRWIVITQNSTAGTIVGLRRDGRVEEWDPAMPADPPALLGSFPFPSSGVTDADRYVDIDFDAGATGWVLRGDGSVFNLTDFLAPQYDLPGDASTEDDTFLDLETFISDVFALRFDGKVYENGMTPEISDLEGSRYRKLASASEPPDLTNFDNNPPVAAIYKTQWITGVSVTVPVVATDIDLDRASLVVTPVVTPAGSVWDPATRTLTFTPPAAGSYPFEVTIDDGVEVPPKTFKYKIKAKDPDTDPTKNKKPLVTKITKAQALVGFAYVLPILAVDPDGDTLTISVDPDVPLPTGSSFDSVTNVFTWTPAFDQVGTTSVSFLVDDGLATKKLKIKITVFNPLIFT
jgi:hypothetical protein